jgi:Membrane carboxypeptidase/penicillin-binding protein PbpC
LWIDFENRSFTSKRSINGCSPPRACCRHADAIRNEYADYDPQNYSHHYFGPVRLREALACSLNVPAVFVLSQLGARPTFYQLQKWGFNFPQGLDDTAPDLFWGMPRRASLILPLRMPDSLAAGQPCARNFWHQNISRSRASPRERRQRLSLIFCAITTRARKVLGLRSPLAFEERVRQKPEPAAASATHGLLASTKTHRRRLGGNFDGRPMRDTFAVRAATPLWAPLCRNCLDAITPLDPPTENDKLIRREICKTTGLVPSRFSNASMPELFLLERSRRRLGTLLCERWEVDFAQRVRALVRDPRQHDRRTRAIRFSHHQSAAERSIPD